MKRILGVIGTFFILLPVYGSPLAIDEAWGPDSDPAIMNFFYKKKFSELPLRASLTNSKKLWSGDYWPLSKGNINYRWYSSKKIGLNLRSPTKEEALDMSIPELAELSPSEKYDLFTGRYDYPLRREVEKIANPNAKIWEGICHGWSPATINHNEPTPKLLLNPDGIRIPFGSTDIKALLSYYYAHVYRSPDTHQMGKRCYGTPSPDCMEDMNAGAFHLILTNRLGLEKKSVIADLQRFEEVWNHPITTYDSRVLGSERPFFNSAPGTVKTVRIQTRVTYLDDNGNDWHPVIGTSKQSYMTQDYDYHLDLDQNGDIIGGRWNSKARPDFLWYTNRARSFEGVLSRLEELLNDE